MLWVAVCRQSMSPLARAVPKLSLPLPFSTSHAALTDLHAPLGPEPKAAAVRAGRRLPGITAPADLDVSRRRVLPPGTHPLTRVQGCFGQETGQGCVAEGWG